MTNSALAAPLGAPLPRVLSHPEFRSSAGAEAVDLAESAGLVLEPWQRNAVNIALAERPDGRWSCFEVGILVARQNGKGAILEAIELAGLFLFGESLILHSAHEFKTAGDAFRRLRALIDGSDDLRRRVARMRTANGQESIELTSGQLLRFVARSKGSGRGFPADRLVLDECQELPEVAVDALLPTLSARPNPQVIYTGTVPGPMNNGEHFERVRDRGRRGEAALAWLEWSPDTTAGVVDLDDPDVWAQANPAMGHGRIDAEFIARERATLSDDGFARERLCIWPESSSSTAIDLSAWSSLVDMEDVRPKPVAFAVEVSTDRQWTHIGVAGVRSDGRRHVQVVTSMRGTSGAAERLAELVEQWSPVAVALDPSGPAGSLLPALTEARVDVETLSAREVAQACGLFIDAVSGFTDGEEREPWVRHPGQAHLDVAVAAATTKPLAGAAVFVPLDRSTDIGPLRAVTEALFVLERETSKKPKRSGAVW